VSKPNDLTATVGTAHLSTSGLALNLVIDQQLHTVPLRSLIPVLNWNHRKERRCLSRWRIWRRI